MQRGRQGSPANRGVGLIIRHGGLIEHDTIEQLVAQQRREEQRRVGEAKERSGRSRRRDRTASDVRGMIGGPEAGRGDVARSLGAAAAAADDPSDSSTSSHPPGSTRFSNACRRVTCDPFSFAPARRTSDG